MGRVDADDREEVTMAKDGDVHLTQLQAIRAKCIECSGGELAAVRNCKVPKCALYPYRMGRDPARAGIGGNPTRELAFSAPGLKSQRGAV